MTERSTSADFVTAFATGWPEQHPEIMVLSLTTHKGMQDFALTKEQALLIAKTMKQTAMQLAAPGQGKPARDWSPATGSAGISPNSVKVKSRPT